jgi:diaminopimelate epimerase
MNYEIVLADPAKNITIFVLTPVENRGEIAKRLLAEPAFHAEQVGFVIPPKTPQGLWRLEMMGGEFCGNAARAFGLLVARTLGLSENCQIPIEISGMQEPLLVTLQVEEETAAVNIPKPLAQDSLAFRSKVLPVYHFQGITHIIAPGFLPEKDLFFEIKALLETKIASPEALGVMFYDQKTAFMTPAVYVYGTDSLVFESSCGSGSAAFGVWQSETVQDGECLCRVTQPGGVIEVRIWKRRKDINALSIGGPVFLGEPLVIEG